jgi:cyanoexosortase A
VNGLLRKAFSLQNWEFDYWVRLIGTAILFALIHLFLTWRLLHQVDQVIFNALFWIAILRILAKVPGRAGEGLPRCIGYFLLGLILVRSLTLAPGEAWFVRLFPVLTLLGLGLLASGFQIRRHWRVGLLLFPLMLPRGIVEQMAELLIGKQTQILTAQFSAFILHYLGFETVRSGTIISLNQGAVEVLFRCTGIPLLILLLQLTCLFLIVYPIPRQQQVRVVLVAVIIAFLLSGARVALMAIVVKDAAAFAFWHGGEGSQFFSTGAIVLFGWFCQQSLPRV